MAPQKSSFRYFSINWPLFGGIIIQRNVVHLFTFVAYAYIYDIYYMYIYMYISWSSVGAHTDRTAKISRRGGIEEESLAPLRVLLTPGDTCVIPQEKKKEAGTKQYVIKM